LRTRFGQNKRMTSPSCFAERELRAPQSTRVLEHARPLYSPLPVSPPRGNWTGHPPHVTLFVACARAPPRPGGTRHSLAPTQCVPPQQRCLVSVSRRPHAHHPPASSACVCCGSGGTVRCAWEAARRAGCCGCHTLAPRGRRRGGGAGGAPPRGPPCLWTFVQGPRRSYVRQGSTYGGPSAAPP
jgi:hypothetical protein